MYTRLSELKNLIIAAQDGDIGRCRDFLFDDEHWTVRYLEINTSRWLLGRRVLISPASVKVPDFREGRLPVSLTRDAIKAAPGLEEHQPISRQYEIDYARYYGQMHYWGGGGVWGIGAYPVDILQTTDTVPPVDENPRKVTDQDHDTPHLRSAAEVIGYRIQATDGELGAVEDFVVDTATWTIVFAMLDTRRWLPGRRVLLPISWAASISWAERAFTVDVSKRSIETAPPLAEPISAEAVKAYLNHFGR